MVQGPTNPKGRKENSLTNCTSREVRTRSTVPGPPSHCVGQPGSVMGLALRVLGYGFKVYGLAFMMLAVVSV